MTRIVYVHLDGRAGDPRLKKGEGKYISMLTVMRRAQISAGQSSSNISLHAIISNSTLVCSSTTGTTKNIFCRTDINSSLVQDVSKQRNDRVSHTTGLTVPWQLVAS